MISRQSAIVFFDEQHVNKGVELLWTGGVNMSPADTTHA